MNRIGNLLTPAALPTVGASWTTSEEHDGWRAVLTHGLGSASYRLVNAVVPVEVRVALDRSTYDDGMPPSTQLVIRHGTAIGDEGSDEGETRVFLKEPTALRGLIAALQAIVDNPDGAGILATTDNIYPSPDVAADDVEDEESEDDEDDDEGEEWKRS